MHTTPPRGRVLAALTALAVVSLAAFVLAPPLLVGGSTGAFRAAFVEYWATGERDLTPRLHAVVDSWARYHLVKAVTAALLLASLTALGAALWRAYRHTTGRRAGIAAAGGAVTVLGLAAVALVMANVQGAASPFASLLPMLLDGPAADAPLAATLDQVRQRLTGDTAAPAAGVMVDAFAHYHAVMAVVAGTVAAALLAVSVAAGRRFLRTPAGDRGIRRAVASFAALMLLSALAVAAVAVANTTVAADPAPALAAFFAGGW
ncbi:hypothetical protein Daura_29700 [Dactylosporangium aurantiacum]|uniref:Tat (Twin-arginine translocation) pathway signal sequence n=1 Tax=Dactylosporangium aurantiacum TaxID=35754 RepID=A0A9Q9ME35_9ACTN|nr:hypothetical protein [Dactylosporangium aurantiacum]MDG6106828.1 hypothetical protein [Dactylosporangium aurantiacum]UWZ50965.1 hypothetical protein Daura_29700 [Dactylosporangium aurantiacum]